MTVYRKCRSCQHSNDCDIKRDLAAAIKGFGVGTISHRCRKYTPDFKPGDNVWVRVNDVPHGNDWDDSTPKLATFPGHFVNYSKSLGRAIVYIAPGAVSDDGDTGFDPANGKSGFCKVSYAPFKSGRPITHWDKGIVAKREGTTPLSTCCGRPIGETCDECKDGLRFA